MPANKALKAIQLKKVEEFNLEMRDPLPLGSQEVEPKDGARSISATSIGSGDMGNSTGHSGDGALPPPSYDEAVFLDPRVAGLQRSDSDLARELSEKLNTE